MICPHCDSELDGMITTKWGDGIQRGNVAPFICSWCASLMLIDKDTGTLITQEEFKTITDLDFTELFRLNKTLWSRIEENRKLILSAPNRRPVLR